MDYKPFKPMQIILKSEVNINRLHISVFDNLIWHTIGLKSFLFGIAQFSLWASGTVNYNYIVTNSHAAILIKNSATYVLVVLHTVISKMFMIILLRR